MLIVIASFHPYQKCISTPATLSSPSYSSSFSKPYQQPQSKPSRVSTYLPPLYPQSCPKTKTAPTVRRHPHSPRPSSSPFSIRQLPDLQSLLSLQPSPPRPRPSHHARRSQLRRLAPQRAPRLSLEPIIAARLHRLHQCHHRSDRCWLLAYVSLALAADEASKCAGAGSCCYCDGVWGIAVAYSGVFDAVSSGVP